MRALATILSMLVAWQAAASDLDTVRSRVLALFTASAADPADALVGAALDATCAGARGVLASISADGSWPDIGYGDPPGYSSSMGDHYGRVRLLALATRLPTCQLFNDATTLRAIEHALAFLQPTYAAGSGRPGNWWWWNIGVPLSLGPALVLVQGAIDPALFSAALAALDANVSAQTELGGANLADHAMNSLLVALVKDDDAAAARATAEMDEVCVITPPGHHVYFDPDGIKPDFSYHQHYGQLYDGGYGQVFIGNVARYALLAQGTSFALSAAGLSTFAEYLWFGTTWMIAGDDFDPNVLGRGTSRKGNHASGALGALLRAALLDSPRRVELLAATKAFVEAWKYGWGLEDAPFVAAIRSAPGRPAWPTGHRFYPDSDFSVHRAQGWYASVKMLSSRRPSGEDTNGEGTRGSRQSDGRLQLVLRGDEYGGDVMPTLDWARLPGITVERQTEAANALYGPGSRAFVGGTGDAKNGVAAMDFAPPKVSGSSLSARKSWFFFDDAIVFLAGMITDPSGSPVETIVEQWPLSSAAAPLFVDGRELPAELGWTGTLSHASWMASDGLGYWFPGGADVHASRVQQAGAWSELGRGSSAPLSAPILTVWLEHGVGPRDAAAAYAIVPGADAAAMAQWSAAPPLEVVSNTAELAAVRDRRTGALGVVFWAPGAIEDVSADAACVLWRVGDQAWVADPARTGQPLHLTIAGTELTLELKEGRTTQVTVTPAAPAKPASPPGCGCGAGGGALALLVVTRRRPAWRLRRGAL